MVGKRLVEEMAGEKASRRDGGGKTLQNKRWGKEVVEKMLKERPSRICGGERANRIGGGGKE